MADLEARFRITTDKGGAEQAAKSVADLKKSAQDANTPLATTRQLFEQINKAGEVLSKTGLNMAKAGAGILAPMMLAANTYIKNAGMAEQTSRDWLKTSDQLAASQMRIGRVIAQETLPYMQEMAKLSQTAASFAEKHPEVVKAAVTLGGGLAFGGTGLFMLGQTANALSLLGTVGTRIGLLGAGTAGAAGASGGAAAASGGAAAGGAAAAGGLTALGLIGSVAGGVTLGLGIEQYMASKGWKGNVAGVPLEARNLGEYPVSGMYGAVKLLGGSEDEAKQSALALAQALGLVAKTADQATVALQGQASGTFGGGGQIGGFGGSGGGGGFGGAGTGNLLEDQPWYGRGLETFMQYSIQQEYAQADHYRDMLRTSYDYQREMRHQEEAYGIQRAISVRNQGMQLNYAEQDYYRQRSINADAFQRSLYLAEQEYYYQRSITARNYSISQSRSAEDYELQTERNEYDHKIRLRNAARTGNATAWLEEQRAYKLSESRREEDYEIARRRAKEDYSLAQGDAETSYERQRKIATDSFAIQEQIQADSYTIQRQRQQEQFDLQLGDQDDNFTRQMRIAAEQHTIQMNRFETDFATEKERQATALEDLLGSMGVFRDEYGAKLDSFKPAFAEFINAGIVDPLNQLRGSLGLQGIESVAVGTGNANAGASFNYGSSGGGSTGSYGGGGGAGGYRAAGGYVGSGMYRLGEQGYEFVLDHTTTKMWEKNLGGSLTQSALQAGTADTLEISFIGNVPAGMDVQEIAAAVSQQIANKYKRVNARVRR